MWVSKYNSDTNDRTILTNKGKNITTLATNYNSFSIVKSTILQMFMD